MCKHINGKKMYFFDLILSILSTDKDTIDIYSHDFKPLLWLTVDVREQIGYI